MLFHGKRAATLALMVCEPAGWITPMQNLGSLAAALKVSLFLAQELACQTLFRTAKLQKIGAIDLQIINKSTGLQVLSDLCRSYWDLSRLQRQALSPVLFVCTWQHNSVCMPCSCLFCLLSFPACKSRIITITHLYTTTAFSFAPCHGTRECDDWCLAD